MDLALTRDVSPQIAHCELSFKSRERIDYRLAVAQHELYCRLLEELGLKVVRLPADPACPDCCFVEDAAVVLDELAVIASMGTPARRTELPPVEAELARHRRLAHVRLPATLEGGDVLRVGKTLFAGLTKRTNAEGVGALRALVAPLGYEVIAVEVKGCLHLKSAVTAVDDETLLANVAWVDPHAFPKLDVLPATEPDAANVLRIGRTVLVHSGFQRTGDLLARRGLSVRTLNVSEFLKAEAGVTCKSILFRSA